MCVRKRGPFVIYDISVILPIKVIINVVISLQSNGGSYGEPKRKRHDPPAMPNHILLYTIVNPAYPITVVSKSYKYGILCYSECVLRVKICFHWHFSEFILMYIFIGELYVAHMPICHTNIGFRNIAHMKIGQKYSNIFYLC